MSLDPFKKGADYKRRQMLESIARGLAKAASGALVTHGLIKPDGSTQLEELLAGIAIYVIGEYLSKRAIDHTENRIDVAIAAPEGTSREAVEVAARQGTYVGGTGG